MKHVDILIVGGGVAGSVFAMQCPKDKNILLLDKKRLDGTLPSFQKPCGGLLSPDAQKSLASLQLSIPLSVMASPQIFSVKTIDIPKKLTRHYQRFYLNVHRHRFDCWLASMIPNHVQVEDQTVVTSVDIQSNPIIVHYRKDNMDHAVSCDILIGADGAGSLVRKAISTRKIRQYLAIQQTFLPQTILPELACFFDPMITDSYGWASVKDDVFTYGIALPLDESHQRFENAKERLHAFGYALSKPEHTEACLVNSPKSIRELVHGKKNVLLIGEAAGWISPSSLEGISYAIDSALLASKAIRYQNPYKTYMRLSLSLMFKIFTKQLKSILLYTPWIRHLILKSNIQTIHIHQKP